ncbi:MAG: RNA polymerase subunit sigma-70 [Clostridia bacterium]|nr:RNA polymerase subunit sigma-70 [Clostridia bacterium]MBQ9729176.1 RNA polymerase subunit sigma-70 [Clostridia bacterium]
MKDDVRFLQLWDLYSPLLTATQREITDLYFNYDLSLAEIAEQKSVSRQSVSDCLNKCRRQLESYEEKLQFAKALDELTAEYSEYMTQVERFIEDEQEKFPALQRLQATLQGVHARFETERSDGVVGKVFREE